MLSVFVRSLRKEGISETLKKTFLYSKKTAPELFRKLRVYSAYLRIKCMTAMLPRFKNRMIKILGLKIYFYDLKSLFMEFKDIFKNQIYHFTPLSHTDEPKIIDGGGFIGISLFYFKKIYPRAKITIFEPSARALNYLKKNISENHLENVEIAECGLAGEVGEITFQSSITDSGKISETGDEKIKIAPLSKYIAEKIDFVKLNIEGAELDVLKDLDEHGAFQYIDQMCIEWHSFANSSQNLDEILAIFKKNKFRYLINHFDYVTNRAVKPPFRLENKTQYYLLIYAKKIFSEKNS